MASGRIRFASIADARRLAEIYNHAVESRMSTCDLDPQPVSVVESWFDGRDFASRPIYVHELEGRVTGYLSVSNFWNDRPGYQVSADCGIYVDPAFHGKGFGAELLGHFVDQAPGLGIVTITTSMFADNRASVRLFAKFGFVRVGLCTGVANLEGVWKDLAIVQRVVAS